MTGSVLQMNPAFNSPTDLCVGGLQRVSTGFGDMAVADHEKPRQFGETPNPLRVSVQGAAEAIGSSPETTAPPVTQTRYRA
jgi:hypothetical protein